LQNGAEFVLAEIHAPHSLSIPRTERSPFRAGSQAVAHSDSSVLRGEMLGSFLDSFPLLIRVEFSGQGVPDQSTTLVFGDIDEGEREIQTGQVVDTRSSSKPGAALEVDEHRIRFG